MTLLYLCPINLSVITGWLCGF